ncbi:hypothetical protein ASF41_11670 [Methylobacterium sp. Leaf111]|uniref:hypothetical protein n=1 Tax=Methylobacterium sp. Leaf111 TaxID=1736257 RepID=UPI0006FB4C48|nr:hypothetical protein [Methylobacterium sp. Leaf111]KQP54343.1 hypothetical protein ASF41_11670 [Methylobacterium sp. Leaf111]
MPRSRSAALAIAGSLTALAPAIGVLTGSLALAEEPLFIRIRPGGEASVGSGGSGAFDDAAAQAARARSEAVWQRAEARSRIAIASVCTGCLAAVPPPSVPVAAPPARADAGGLTPLAADSPAVPPPPLAQADAP